MDDRQIYALRQDPPPAFARQLRSRLGQGPRPSGRERTRLHPGRLLWVAGAVGALAVLFSFPAVRASAQSFLSLFRVVNFAAVPVDPGRLDALRAPDLDLDSLIGDHVEVLQDPGPPVPVASPEAAGTLAGFDVHLPGWLPDGTTIVDVEVAGARAARVTADPERLRQVMDALGITDLAVPDGLEGATATIRVPPVVMIRFEHGTRHTRLFQAPAPEVDMPAGVNPAALGEIGLRILGLSPAAAHQMALDIDWTSTLVVPVPPTASSFLPVDVGGEPGIAIEFQPPNASRTNMILWSHSGRVYGLMSLQTMSQVLQVASSIQ
jgi:hypothetical protein